MTGISVLLPLLILNRFNRANARIRRQIHLQIFQSFCIVSQQNIYKILFVRICSNCCNGTRLIMCIKFRTMPNKRHTLFPVHLKRFNSKMLTIAIIGFLLTICVVCSILLFLYILFAHLYLSFFPFLCWKWQIFCVVTTYIYNKIFDWIVGAKSASNWFQ